MTDSQTIAFIGLGIMGAPMSVNLARAGYRVVGFSRRPESAAALIDAGGTRAESVREAVTGADVVITMLPDSPQVSQIVLGPDGVLDSVAEGALLIDMSSIAPAVSREIANASSGRGVSALDAPVSGGEQGAIEGILSVMVGGDAAAFERALPILKVVGTTIVHVGPSGSGQTVKLANQLIVAGNLQVVAEALVFLERQNVDTTAALDVLAGGLAGSTVLNRKGASMTSRQFAPGFRIALHDKDLRNFTETAREVSLEAPLGALLAQLFAGANADGLGDLDHSALFRLVEQNSGTREQ